MGIYVRVAADESVTARLYTDVAKELGNQLGTSYFLLTEEDIEKHTNDLKEMVESKINNINVNRQKVLRDDPTATVELIDLPTVEEIRKGIQEAVARGDRERARLESEEATGTLKELVDVPEELSGEISKLFEGVEELRNVYTLPLGLPTQVPDYPGVEFAAPDIHIINLDRFLDKWGLEAKQKKVVRDYLTQKGFQAREHNKYYLKGDKFKEFLSTLQTLLKQASRSATYFNLFQEFDEVGGSWTLDEGGQKIMRKPIDTEDAIRKGGLWEYSVGAKIHVDTQTHDLIPVTITAQLPRRRYMVKTQAGLELEVHETDIVKNQKLF